MYANNITANKRPNTRDPVSAEFNILDNNVLV